MITLSRLFLLVCLALAGGFVAVRAQPAAAPAASEGVEISIVGLGQMPSVVKIADGPRALEAPVQSSGKGAPFRHKGGSPLVFFREVKDAEGRLRRETVATVEYPPEWKRMLVVLLADARRPGQDAFTAQVFDDGAEGFPAGTARVFNFFRTTLAANSGDALEQVPSGQSRLMRLSGARARVWLKLARQGPTEWELLPTFVTQFSPDRRLLLFLYETKGEDGQVERIYRNIPEVAPAPSSPAAP